MNAISLNPIQLIKSAFLLLAVVAFASCQKEINPLEEDGNPSGGGGTDNPATGSYMPHSKGSYWTYQDSADTDLEYRIMATDQKKTLNGITYYLYEDLDSPDGNVYYGQQGNDYYLLIEQETIGTESDLHLLYLKGDANVGASWIKEVGAINGIPARISGSIVAKGFEHNWTGILFKDIVQSKVELQYNLLGTWMTTISTM
jgi:hypothetical protein